mmetsp:Transcript_59800/g.142377  ORF Transcript_59800/g.142377 Transcript_59800/m.142377 type:complete len:99 (-) Transcript_59800:3853-4149(-)
MPLPGKARIKSLMRAPWRMWSGIKGMTSGARGPTATLVGMCACLDGGVADGQLLARRRDPGPGDSSLSVTNLCPPRLEGSGVPLVALAEETTCARVLK